MAETAAYMLAQTFQLTAQTPKTTDDRGSMVSRTVAAAYYRTLLAATAGTGTATDPAELLTAVQTALGSSKWSVQLTAAGLVQVTYTGTGTGTLILSTCPTLRSLLGFSSDVGPLAASGSSTAPYPPTHCLFALAADPDSGWVDDAARFAGARLPDGTVYGWDDGRHGFTRKASFRFLPKDWSTRATLSAVGTPAFSPSSRTLSPASGEPGQDPPWSAADTLATATTRQLGVTWGDLQAIIAGTASTFDLCYLTPECRTQGGRIALSVDRYDARRDVALEFSYAGAGSR